MILRQTTPADRPVVLGLIGRAFTRNGGAEEMQIARDIWASPHHVPHLDLVAEDAGRILGHVLHSRGDLAGAPRLGLAPLAVEPDTQTRGIGSALVHEALRIAGAAGEPFIVLLGAPAYYGRFGFEPASRYGVRYGPIADRANQDAFQLHPLAAFDPASPGGVYRYAWEL